MLLADRAGMPGLMTHGKPDFAAAEQAQDALRTIVDRKLFEAGTRPLNLFLHARIGSASGYGVPSDLVRRELVRASATAVSTGPCVR